MSGRTIANFELLQELGAESGIEAYKARDTTTGRLVVFHVLRETQRLTSHHELRVAGALSHPNLVDIWETGEFEEEGRLASFFITPFLDGVTLGDLIRQAHQPLNLERIVDMARQVCAGWQVAHDQALVHGHLTPGSILITDRGLVKIMDFGLMRRSLSESVSPDASPEQVVGGKVSTSSDIFSLGVIIYEALTLRNPFARPERIATAAAIMRQVPPPASEVNPAVSRAVSHVIQQAIAKQPAERFVSAREFGEALHAASRNELTEQSGQARLRMSKARRALQAGDLQFAGEIINGLESEGFLDDELKALRGRLERELRDKSIRQILEMAQSRLEAREFSSALAQVQEALNIDPENPIARTLLADIERNVQINRVRMEQDKLYRSAMELYQHGDIESALHHLENLIELTRRIPETAGLEPEARYRTFYQQLLEERDAQAVYLEAHQHLAQGKFQSAMDTCAQALARHPQNERLLALIREVKELQERRKSTILEDVTRRVELEADLDRRVAILTEAVQRYPAEPQFQQSLTLMRERRELVNSIRAKAQQLEEQGQLSEALNQIEMLRSVSPDSPNIDSDVNRILERRDQQARATAKSRLSEQADREIASGNYSRALDILSEAVAQFPDDAELASRITVLGRAAAEQARRTEQESSPAEIPSPQPVPVLDHVHFTITAPSRLKAGDSFELYFWVHLDKQRETIIDRAMLALGVGKPEEMVMKSEGPVPLPRGTVVSARVCIAGLSVDPYEKSVVWSGEAGCASFIVAVPTGAAQRQYHGTVSIRVNSCEIARMDFVLRVAGKSGRVPAKLKRHTTAFASYASEDRDAVLARVQGMQKVAPWLKVFMDVIDMRSGDIWQKNLRKKIRGSDIFYLFWCSHARASEWVEREWRYAYEKRGLEFIDPVPLEAPRKAPPPDELKTKHFNDLWTELNGKSHG